MDEQPPTPWEEFFQALKIPHNPVGAANTWFHAAQFSSLYPKQADLNELLRFLKTAIPEIEPVTNKLMMKPRFVGYSQAFQSNLLCFLANNAQEHKDCLRELAALCIPVYKAAKNEMLLHYVACLPGCSQHITETELKPLFDQVHHEIQQCFPDSSLTKDADRLLSSSIYSWITEQQGILNKFETEDGKSAESNSHNSKHKLVNNQNENSPTAVLPKKACLSSVLSTVEAKVSIHFNKSSDCDKTMVNTALVGASVDTPVDSSETVLSSDVVDELKSIISKDDCDSFYHFLQTHSDDTVKQICDCCMISMDLILSVSEKFLLVVDTNDCSGGLKSFLAHVCVKFICNIQNSAPRKFTQVMQRLAKKFPESFTCCCLVPVLDKSFIISSGQSTLIMTIIKNSLITSHQVVLLKTLVKTNTESVKSLDAVAVLLQGLVDLKLDLESECLTSLCRFLSLCLEIAVASFPAAKLAMSLVKNYGPALSKDEIALLKKSLESNKTTLKNACMALLSSL